MCGIFALLNNSNEYDIFQEGTSYKEPIHIRKSSFSEEFITNQIMKGQGRGPEDTKIKDYFHNVIFGFHRLAINGLNDISNQPITINNVTIICNGEIYNYKELYQMSKTIPQTGSDCEVIIHLYIKYGIEHTLNILDGVFAFVLLDMRTIPKMYVARDPYGVRPLYFLKCNGTDNYRNFMLIGYASELKCLHEFTNKPKNQYIIQHFTPGTYSLLCYSTKINEWSHIFNQKYIIPAFSLSLPYNSQAYDLNDASAIIQTMLVRAVSKRCTTTERPVACLLSGGLDSSLIAALVCKSLKNIYVPETYSIGLEGSEDLKYAKQVANHIKSKHTEIIVTEDDMFNAIPEVIKAIESYDTTTIRASLGNYLIGKYIKEHSEAKVIFNGDGSDELFGGYLYMNKCPDDIEFDKETRELLKNIHAFDVLRSDKCISSHGLEPRTPFLDKNLVNVVLSMPAYIRNHKNFNDKKYGSIEKYILRNAFAISQLDETLYGSNGLLPESILWRKKEAFSDGVSSHGRSLYQILQEKIAVKLNENTSNKIKYTANIETEKLYYKQIFDSLYSGCDHVIPHFWMPKYTDATDPSARTLDIYTNNT